MVWAEIQGQMEAFAAIIQKIPGVIWHKSGDSNYYTLPTGHIIRLANHPSFDLAGQSADIDIHPRGDGRYWRFQSKKWSRGVGWFDRRIPSGSG